MKATFVFKLILALLLSFAVTCGAFANDITAPELTAEISKKLPSVLEFQFIQAQAEKMGVRVWLFGGTAAGFAHYIKWDLQRRHGDTRFQPNRFDYDYTNIYRSNQDLDIVIDGNAAQAQQLQQELTNAFPHMQGNKTAWEVRLLTQDMGDKQALLNNPDFLHQHTDSNSTGMIELTHSNEPVVRDLRDWQSNDPYFLEDVVHDQLHYYYSDKHNTTSFYQQGRNPEIISAIRYLTKAFQYELKMSPEDKAKIKKVIDDFNPTADQNSYVSHWVIKNGKKLIQNAVNIEYAINTLDHLGLRQKLMQFDSKNTSDSLAWWMNKEPLRTYQTGTGDGKTAKELGIDIVAHETNNFMAYESITRAHTGDPNVLISRTNAIDEAAAYGDGFYTKIGKQGARGTGLTIRFHLIPQAREGTDFIRHDDYVVIRNKSCLKVIPESLNFGIVEYFEFLKSSEITAADRGLLEKLKRRIDNHANVITPEEEKKIVQIIKIDIEKSHESYVSPIFKEWLSLKISLHHPELIEELIRKGAADSYIARYILSQPQWTDHPELVEALIKKGNADSDVAQYILSQPQWAGHPELVETLIKKETMDTYIAQYILSKPQWADHFEWVEALIKKGNADREIAAYILSQPQWAGHPELVEALIEKGTADQQIAKYVLSQPQWKDHPEWVEALIKKGNIDSYIAAYALSKPQWADHSEWVEALIRKGDADSYIAQYVLSEPHWADHPEWVEALIKKGDADEAIVHYVLPRPQWKDHPEWVETLIRRGTVDEAIAISTLSRPQWKDHPELVEALLKKGTADRIVASYILSVSQWANHPEWIETLIKKGTVDIELTAFALSKPFWIDNLQLQAICKNRKVSLQNLREAFNNGATFYKSTQPSTAAMMCHAVWL